MAFNSAPLSVFDLAPLVKSGEDITQPLLTAISNLPTTGAISIPFGTYLVTGQISVGAKEVTFYLNGATLQANSSFTGSMFYTDSVGGEIVIRGGGGAIDGNKATYTITGYGINIGSNAKPGALYDVTVQNFPTQGVTNTGTGDFYAQNSFMVNNGGTGLSGQGITGTCTAVSCGASGNGNGGWIMGGSIGTDFIGGNYSNNTFNGCAAYWGQNGLTYAHNARMIGVTACNNTGGASGISIGQGIKESTVIGCTCLNNDSIDINIDTTLNNGINNGGVTYVEANFTVEGNVVGGSSLPIRVNGALKGVVSGNFIKSTSGSNGGIYVLNGSADILVDGNYLLGTTTFIQVGAGSSIIKGRNNVFPSLATTTLPYQGDGVLKSSSNSFGDNTNTTYGNVMPADILYKDTTAGNITEPLPSAALVGDGFEITFCKSVAANTLNISLFAGDKFYTSGANSTSADAYTAIGAMVTYRATVNGAFLGWRKILWS